MIIIYHFYLSWYSDPWNQSTDWKVRGTPPQTFQSGGLNFVGLRDGVRGRVRCGVRWDAGGLLESCPTELDFKVLWTKLDPRRTSYFMAGRRSASDPIGPALDPFRSVQVRTGPERTSNGSTAWTFKTDSVGPDTDSASDFKVQSDPYRVRYGSNKVRAGALKESARFQNESPHRTRFRIQ